MTRTTLVALVTTLAPLGACQLAEDAAVRHAESLSAKHTAPPHVSDVVLLPTSFLANSSPSVPGALRDAGPTLEACGVGRDDVVEAQIVARAGEWPWEVRGLGASPVDRCVSGVLSTLPLDDRLVAGGVRVVDFAVRPADLGSAPKTTWRADDALSCSAWRHPNADDGWYRLFGDRFTQHQTGSVSPAGKYALELACESEIPLTRVELVWHFGELVDVRTSPEVPCVEEAAWALADRDPHPYEPILAGADRGEPGFAARWDEARCTIVVPLRPEGA